MGIDALILGYLIYVTGEAGVSLVQICAQFRDRSVLQRMGRGFYGGGCGRRSLQVCCEHKERRERREMRKEFKLWERMSVRILVPRPHEYQSLR